MSEEPDPIDTTEFITAWRDVFAGWEETLALLDPIHTDDFNLDEQIEMWDALDKIIAILAVYRRTWAVAAGKGLPWKGNYDHPTLGQFHRAAYANEQWNGAGVLTALSEPLVDTNTGEMKQAVPTEILRDVLPAVGEGMTSSRWKPKGLEAHGYDPDKYRTVTWGDATVNRGPRR